MEKETKIKPQEGKKLTAEELAQERENIGAKLRGIRIKRGLSMDDVVAALDIPKPQLSKDENGKLNIGLDRLIRYAAFYQVDILRIEVTDLKLN